jgi:hypothetical protein
MKIKQVPTRRSKDLPKQLQIKSGKLVCVDGTEPDFSELPDGDYNLMVREGVTGLLDDAYIMRRFGA